MSDRGELWTFRAHVGRRTRKRTSSPLMTKSEAALRCRNIEPRKVRAGAREHQRSPNEPRSSRTIRIRSCKQCHIAVPLESNALGTSVPPRLGVPRPRFLSKSSVSPGGPRSLRATARPVTVGSRTSSMSAESTKTQKIEEHWRTKPSATSPALEENWTPRASRSRGGNRGEVLARCISYIRHFAIAAHSPRGLPGDIRQRLERPSDCCEGQDGFAPSSRNRETLVERRALPELIARSSSRKARRSIPCSHHACRNLPTSIS